MPIARTIMYVLMFAPAPFEALIVALMLRRREAGRLPLFFSYLCFDLFAFVCVAPLYLGSKAVAYFYTFWIMRAILLFLGLLVIHEVTRQVFESYDSLHRVATIGVQLLSVALVAFAIFTAVQSPGTDKSRLLAGLFVMERSVHMVQTGLLLFLFLFSRALALSWRSHVFGVALGFGVIATAQLALIAVRTYSGSHGNTWQVLAMGAEACAVLIWTGYFRKPEQKQIVAMVPSGDVEEWNQALSHLLHR